MQSIDKTSIQYLKGVGPARKKLFSNLGVETIEDLLYFFPRRYEDRRVMTSIAQLKAGEWQTTTGKVLVSDARRSWYTKKHVFEITLDDKQGRLTCVWFNMPFLSYYFKPGTSVVVYGRVQTYKNRLQMISPEYEIISDDEKDNLNIGRIVPIYPLTRGLSQRYLRKIIFNCLDKHSADLKDFLPVAVRNKYKLSNTKRTIQSLHFPETLPEQEGAYKRLCFEEFFFFQVSAILRKLSVKTKTGISHRIPEELVKQFAKGFPFSLTKAQERVIKEMSEDLKQDVPMLRLLQGDVGSGKTIVSFFGCVAAFSSGFQSAIMAPTEILARQHYFSIQEFLKSGPFKDLKIALLISQMNKKEKEEVLAQLKNGKIDLLIGTHALLSENIEFKDLSYVVVDEQHKFGVQQRALLAGKGKSPHILVMTATPIPRTLSMTVYGDLDISTLDEMPKGRGKIKTEMYTIEQSDEVYKIIRDLVKKGGQAYIVYPIIEESETWTPRRFPTDHEEKGRGADPIQGVGVKAAQKMFKQFCQKEFKEFKVGLIHGQMKRQDTDEIMRKFKNKETHILVATTVLEVGVDVPDCNIMVVEHAERFGLSQLHQLRGRVGRGQADALCILVAEPTTPQAKARLDAVLSTTDGFKIAEEDLKIRGPGQYFGRSQHGLSELKIADPVAQMDILKLARDEALSLTKEDPKLEKPLNAPIRLVAQKRYPGYLKMAESG